MQAEEVVRASPSPPQDPAMDPVRVVEAALFSAGKPLALDEIAENTHLARRQVTDALKKLAAEYDHRDTALEVGRAGEKWAMQVRARYAPATSRLAPMEIAPRLVRTLALIAYHQPVLQSALIDMVGDKGYEHVRELTERGLVRKRVDGRSFQLVTTETFPEYFGIPASDRHEIKVFLAKKLGIDIPKDDGKGNAVLETFPEGGASAAPPAASAPPSE